MSSPTKNLRGSTASSVDVLIIGGGFSGCWFADKLHSDKPELSVRLVEASAKLGGRLRSDENDGGGTLVKDELGGMRMFPESMPQIKALVERFKLTLAQLPLGDSTNLYYADDKAGQKKDAVMPAGGEWEGKAPGAMADAALKAYKVCVSKLALNDLVCYNVTSHVVVFLLLSILGYPVLGRMRTSCVCLS